MVDDSELTKYIIGTSKDISSIKTSIQNIEKIQDNTSKVVQDHETRLSKVEERHSMEDNGNSQHLVKKGFRMERNNTIMMGILTTVYTVIVILVRFWGH